MQAMTFIGKLAETQLTLKKVQLMKFIVSSTYLLKQLQVLGGVINNSNTLPILDNFLFDLKQNKLTVSASDLETTMSSVLNVDSDNEGVIAVPARLLLETLKTFPEQPLTFIVEDNNKSHNKIIYADNSDSPFLLLDLVSNLVIIPQE